MSLGEKAIVCACEDVSVHDVMMYTPPDSLSTAANSAFNRSRSPMRKLARKILRWAPLIKSIWPPPAPARSGTATSLMPVRFCSIRKSMCE